MPRWLYWVCFPQIVSQIFPLRLCCERQLAFSVTIFTKPLVSRKFQSETIFAAFLFVILCFPFSFFLSLLLSEIDIHIENLCTIQLAWSLMDPWRPRNNFCKLFFAKIMFVLLSYSNNMDRVWAGFGCLACFVVLIWHERSVHVSENRFWLKFMWLL